MAKSVISKVSIIAFIATTVLIGMCSGSAIPMWEYLSRGEKMSHLYSTFAKQVQSYCKTSSDNAVHCKRELLMYGLGKLQDMSESHLDSMDPYQRGASDIIWDSMMDGHPMNGKKEVTTPSKIMYPTGQFEHNPLFDDKPETTSTKNNKKTQSVSDVDFSLYASGMDSAYSEPQNSINHQEAPTNINLQYVPRPSTNSVYGPISGPMIVRVRPDGTPVDEQQPRDDDRDAMQIGREKLPTMDQIAQIFRVDPTATGKYYDASPKYFTFTPTGYRTYQIDRQSVKYQ